MNLYHEVVLACAQKMGQVKLCHVVGTLGVTHVLAVEPNLCTRVDTAEMYDGTLLVPALRQVEATVICTYGIDGIVLAAVVETGTGLDEGRSVAVRILHIAIDGAVVALHLPARRYGDGIRLACNVAVSGRLGCLEGRHIHHLHISSHLTLLGYFGKPEVPCAIESLVESALRLCPGSCIIILVGLHLCLAGIGHIGCHTGELVYLEDGFIFPNGRRQLWLLHLLDGEP